MIDLSETKQTLRTFDGEHHVKLGVNVNGASYMLKLPYNSEPLLGEGVAMSSVCEDLAARIFRLYGIESQKTMLCERRERLAVLCSDFVEEGQRFVKFSEFRSTYEDANSRDDSFLQLTQSDLNVTLDVIEHHPILAEMPNLEEDFLKRFLMDAFLGNANRTNDNWGFLVSSNGEIRLAPVFANGASLNSNCGAEKMRKILDDDSSFLAEAYTMKVCYHTIRGKRVNPFKLLKSGQDPKLNDTIKWFVQQDKLLNVLQLVNENKWLDDLHKEFYVRLLSERHNYFEDSMEMRVF